MVVRKIEVGYEPDEPLAKRNSQDSGPGQAAYIFFFRNTVVQSYDDNVGIYRKDLSHFVPCCKQLTYCSGAAVVFLQAVHMIIQRIYPRGSKETRLPPAAAHYLTETARLTNHFMRSQKQRTHRTAQAFGETNADAVKYLPVLNRRLARFDQCMFTVGARSGTGYSYQGTRGAVSPRSALSFDLSGHAVAPYDLMAFPGEEPPQIECNEDAGGQDTEE